MSPPQPAEGGTSTHPPHPSSDGSSPASRDKQTLDYIVKSLIAGGVAGAAAKSVIAPLDRVKILFQTSNPHYARHAGSFLGMFTATRDILATDGIRGLFQGHSATVLRIFPYAAIKFMSYEQYKHLLMPSKADEVWWKHTLAGSAAGITTVLFTYPLDLIRVRLAYEVRTTTQKKSWGILSICRDIYREPSVFIYNPHGALKPIAGITNFYRGFFPTLWGMIPYAGVSFAVYENIKRFFVQGHRSPWTIKNYHEWEATGFDASFKPKLQSWVYLCCGAISGGIGQAASYPFEVIRRHMQVAGTLTSSLGGGLAPVVGVPVPDPKVEETTVKHRSKRFSTTLDTAREIYRKRGIRGFFVGLSIGFVKVAPMHAVSFLVYEWMKYQLEL
ncbi:mitochondrial carrier domain-containing protein [Polychytrium aggregatum]|uniref:mitochondrial carrier domain-containing protein n=1 Tax=Polychytrium aggregatum TaxID=110093 RepID=UPI0022FE5694|nr:mitochondrial carrier domain-containing protein [Polychytrium aggregatum]KAI9204701.1 mitochondrial carrier domain-containing protein [Polychytrium aggregatum]